MKVNSTEGGEEIKDREPFDKFEVGVETLINKLSLEDESNTPDYISAEFIRKVFEIFNKAIIQRTKWYSVPPSHPSGEEAAYWKQRCEAAEKLLDCVDNNINKRFIGYVEWQQFKKEKENPNA